MPIYEYHCSKCGEDFEIITFSTQGEQVTCEKCSSLDVIKKVSAGSYHRSTSSSSIPAGAMCGESCKSGFS